jgi:hypothetical protein
MQRALGVVDIVIILQKMEFNDSTALAILLGMVSAHPAIFFLPIGKIRTVRKISHLHLPYPYQLLCCHFVK